MSNSPAVFSEISPSEFFYRNRDLAGFSNPARALYTAIRELVENSLDACESMGIKPNLEISLKSLDNSSPDPKYYVLKVRDNGPGILDSNIPLAFGRVFYGSKFVLKQARGMFGLGGTMAILYGQITTNKPVMIRSSSDGKILHNYKMMIDIQNNRPIVLNKSEKPTTRTGTSLEITLIGDYFRSIQKIQEYIRQTALVNPYSNIKYTDPKNNVFEYNRVINVMPPNPKETQPHPYGVDVETIRRLINSNSSNLVDSNNKLLENELHNLLSIQMSDLVKCKNFLFNDIINNNKIDFNTNILNLSDILSSNSSLNITYDDKKFSQTISIFENIIKKWSDMSKTLRNFLSIYLQSTIEMKSVYNISPNSINLINNRIFLPSNTTESKNLIKINPFNDHLLEVAGGDSILKFMSNFHRVGVSNANKFCTFSGFSSSRKVRTLGNTDLVKFVTALHKFEDFLMPDASCLSPLGEKILEAGIVKELQPEFVSVSKRPASAYSGFPFVAEVGLAYGGKVVTKGIKLLRFANRIPLLYDEGSDLSWKILNEEVDWKRYRIPQDAPLSIITHICSTKIPYKTVGKEYISDRPEIEKELKNGVREVLRKLSYYLSKKGSLAMIQRKQNIYSKYLPLIARFSTVLIGADQEPNYKSLLNTKDKLNGDDESNNQINTSENVEQQTTIEEYK